MALKAKNLVCFSRIWEGLLAVERTSNPLLGHLLTDPSKIPQKSLPISSPSAPVTEMATATASSKELVSFQTQDLFWNLPEPFRHQLHASCNAPQLATVRAALSYWWSQVLGPPGSGKTFTSLHVLNAVDLALRCKRDCFFPSPDTASTVHSAVVAPSNEAADQLLLRLLARGFLAGVRRPSPAFGTSQADYAPFIVRIGNEDNMAPDVACRPELNVHLIVRELLELRWQKGGNREHPHWQQRLEMEEATLLQQLQELTSIFEATEQGDQTFVRRKELNERSLRDHAALQRKIRILCRQKCLMIVSLSRYPNQAAKALLPIIVDTAELVVGTVNSMASIRGFCEGHLRKFDFVLVDEACQLKECEAVLALLNCSRMQQLGDPRQLGPTILYTGRHRPALVRSLFERLLSTRRVPTVMLTNQYRMHPEISAFPSSYFYASKLVDSVPAAAFEEAGIKTLYQSFSPYQFFGHPRHRGEGRQEPDEQGGGRTGVQHCRPRCESSRWS